MNWRGILHQIPLLQQERVFGRVFSARASCSTGRQQEREHKSSEKQELSCENKYQGRAGVQKPPGALSLPPPPVNPGLHAFVGWTGAFSGHCVPSLPELSSFRAPAAPALHLVTVLSQITVLISPVWLPPYHSASEFLN